MSARSRAWWRHPILETKNWNARRKTLKATEAKQRHLPLREFLYLDAVSVHSLLVSQNATIPDEVTQAISRSDEAEINGKAGAKVGNDLVGSGSVESSARYQTSNSNSTQSSRKAIIQTLFKELRELPLDFKLERAGSTPAPLSSLEHIEAPGQQGVESADAFSRGTLVEVEVTLAVDPVFKLGTMMTEWTAMADDIPHMFGEGDRLTFLHNSQPIMKVLDRFLAGLIPIRATATDHVVATVGANDYIVRRSVLGSLNVKTRPLQIVGVTEHIGYWRDIRRVLFSNARVTMLCRVARDGLQTTWTPVKLADLFSEVAPDFVDQVNAVRMPTAQTARAAQPAQGQNHAMVTALMEYKAALTPTDAQWPAGADAELQAVVLLAASGATDAAAQRVAFDEVRDFVTTTLDIVPPSADADQAVRAHARTSAGLSLFPSAPLVPTVAGNSDGSPLRDEERMLDTEVIAIYW